jgi:ATP-binding cassette, subfamily B, bacterial
MERKSKIARDKAYSGQKPLWPFIKRLAAYFGNYKIWTRSLIIFVLINAATEATMPLVWKYLIDSAIVPGAESGSLGFSVSWALIGIFMAIYFALLGTNAYSEKKMIITTGLLRHNIIRDLRSQMFAKMQALQYSYYDKNSSGWLVARLTYDTERLSEIISWGLINILASSIMILACLVGMAILSPGLTLMVIATLPVVLFISVKLKVLMLRHSREARRQNSELTGYFTENLNAIELVKSNAIEDYRNGGFVSISRKLKKASLKTSVYSSIFNPLLVFLGAAAAAGALFFGGKLAFGAGLMSIGAYAAFFAYVRNIFMPLFDIARTYASALSSLSAGERIFSLIDEPLAIIDKPGQNKAAELSGDIWLKGVSFSYIKGIDIISGLDLRLNAGESVALVGPSGGGKTTIASLICRFYEPVTGTVLADGIDIRDIDMRAYLSQIGVIPQVPHLFAGTVKSNVCFADPSISDAEVEKTLRLIGAEALVPRMHAQVGNEGARLSNGEKQMVSFARAIIKKPRLLVMDEATSSMDAAAELKVRESIKTILKGRTALVIAHRLSTIKGCDRIIFVKDGAIAEQGKHGYLMQKQGAYYQYYKSYAACGTPVFAEGS